jgi:FADH2 O2-dependent halogenase
LKQLSGLRLAGGGFDEFFVLQEKIDALIDQVDIDDAADVERTIIQMHTLFDSFKWMSSAIRDLLSGKNHLPNNKLRVNLFNKSDGFFGDGLYREHFFGDAKSLDLILKAVQEQARYSVVALSAQRRNARLAKQTKTRYIVGKGEKVAL